MARSLSSDHPVVRETARLLADDPSLTTFDLMTRLADSLGPEVPRKILVSQFQRRVRIPAELLLYEESVSKRNGANREEVGQAHGTPSEDGLVRPAEEKSPQSPPIREPAIRGEDLDALILEAFTLGVEAVTRAEVVGAFRELDQVRRKARRLGMYDADGGTARSPNGSGGDVSAAAE